MLGAFQAVPSQVSPSSSNARSHASFKINEASLTCLLYSDPLFPRRRYISHPDLTGEETEAQRGVPGPGTPGKPSLGVAAWVAHLHSQR